MEFIPTLALTAAAVLLAWLGVRRRRKAFSDFADDCKRYTATVPMRVISMQKSEEERWEDQEDGSRILFRDTVYTPIYEYAVNGVTYQYCSSRSYSTDNYIGHEVTGYYDPANPHCITEDCPRKPVLSGLLFFLLSAGLIAAALKLLLQALYF